MRSNWWYLPSLLLVLAILGGCTPKAAPPIATTGTTAISATPKAAAPAITLEDAAWDEVVKASKKENKVVLYSFTWVGDVGVALADAFSKRWGITVEIINAPGAGIVERVKTEQRAKMYTSDLVEFSGSYSASLLKEGYFVSVVTELPALREDVWIVNPKTDAAGNILAHSFQIQTPWVNTKLVKPGEEPTSWADLLDPRWRGKILMYDPRTTSSADTGVHGLLKYKVVPADYFQKLAAQVVIPPGVGIWAPWQALIRGEGPILSWGTDGSGQTFQEQGAPIKPILTREGVIGNSTPIQMLKNAPHPNAGRVFLNFIFTAQGQEILGRFRKNIPNRKDVPNYSMFAGLTLPRIAQFTQEDRDEQDENFRLGVAAKLFGLR